MGACGVAAVPCEAVQFGPPPIRTQFREAVASSKHPGSEFHIPLAAEMMPQY
jgi:hypothetical protein